VIDSLNDADANFIDVVVVSTYTTPSTIPAMAINILAGEGALQQSAVFATFLSSAPAAYACFSLDQLTLTDVEVIVTVAGDIPQFAMYSITGGDKMVITIGVSTLTLSNPATQKAIIFQVNDTTPASVISNRVTVSSGPGVTSLVELVQAIGQTNLGVTATYVDFSAVPIPFQILAEGLANPAGNQPQVAILNTSFVNGRVPASTGSFLNKLGYNIADSNGSTVTSGGIYTNVKTVVGTYVVQSDDNLVIETLANSVVILQDPENPNIPTNPANPSNPSNPSFPFDPFTNLGQTVIVKNDSKGKIYVQANFMDKRKIVTIKAGRSLTFQNDAVFWYIVGESKEKKNKNHCPCECKQKDKKKC